SRHTRWPRDWSSDVCSSDLVWRTTLYGSGLYLFNPRNTNGVLTGRGRASEAIMSVSDQYLARAGVLFHVPKTLGWTASFGGRIRSEERRVGKGWRARWSTRA